MSLKQVNIDPIKYLNNLPIYNGSRDDLYSFTELVDRVYPLLAKYDDISQGIFYDIIKSRLTEKAREAIEINNTVKSWEEVKKLFFHNFGDRLSIDQLYDELRSLTFKTNCFDFYNEIKAILRRLNNKTKIEKGKSEEIQSNCKTALRIFINKIPDPMKGILCCRNPDDLEKAIQILHETGYAFTRVGLGRNRNNNCSNNNGNKINNSRNNTNHKNNDKNPNNGQNYNRNNRYNNDKNYGNNTRYNQFYQKSGTFKNNNNSNQSVNSTNTVQPMDVDTSTINRRTYNLEETQGQKKNG